MKIRMGFVTNSSSSSFILVFKNEDDYTDFKNSCNNSNYKEVSKLIDRCRKINAKNAYCKTNILENLHNWMILDWQREYLKEKVPDNIFFHERLKKEEEILMTEKYKDDERKFLSSTDYEKLKDKISKAEIIVSDTIWDTDGGVLEYAIRHGLLREFFPWFVYQIDIG